MQSNKHVRLVIDELQRRQERAQTQDTSYAEFVAACEALAAQVTVRHPDLPSTPTPRTPVR